METVAYHVVYMVVIDPVANLTVFLYIIISKCPSYVIVGQDKSLLLTDA
jgi:hypothetical protein